MISAPMVIRRCLQPTRPGAGARMNPTKRNHYNPCFWTALWNEAHYARVISRASGGLSPRSQSVSALNVRSGKVYTTTVENVHFDKNLGLADITPDAMKDFCRGVFPANMKRLPAISMSTPIRS